jgi:glyoxylase-like metal-dependent hydrolase (beta-lactamase superfamily II)
VVSSYAIDDGEHLLLFDPLAVPSEIIELAADRKLVVVLTAPWHERDTRTPGRGTRDAGVRAPPDSQEDLMQKYGVTAEEAAGGSPDVAWLLAGDTFEAHLYAAGDRLPVGVEAFPGRLPNDLVLWVESRRALVLGDTLIDFGQGLEIARGDELQSGSDHDFESLPQGVTREQIAVRLRPLLALPVEHLLATHGGPRPDSPRAGARLAPEPGDNCMLRPWGFDLAGIAVPVLLHGRQDMFVPPGHGEWLAKLPASRPGCSTMMGTRHW